MVGRGRPLVRRVRSATEMPTRRQTRQCVVAKASLDIFSRLPSAWRSYDSCAVRGLDSAQAVATKVTMVCRTFTPDQGFTDLRLSQNGQVTPGCPGSGTAVLAGSGWHTRVALGSAETEHGDANAVVVAALSASEWSEQHSRHSRFLRGDL